MLHHFSAAISELYAAATNAASWRQALTAIERLTGSAGAVVHVVPKGGPVTSFIGASAEEHFPDKDVEEWTRELAPICPRLAAGARWPNAPYVVDRMILTERQMDLDPVYEWYGQHGLRYFIGSPLFSTPAVDAFWSLQRTPRQGHAQAADIQLFELVKPHMSRALALAEQLGTLRSFERFSSAVLQTLAQALFALGCDGKVLFANRAAELLLRNGDGLGCVGGRLRTAIPTEQEQFDRLIRNAALAEFAASSGWARISRKGGGPLLAAFVAPLDCADDELMEAQARVLVIVHDTGDRRSPDPRMLIELFELTDAEARLARALAAGHSVESAAALLGVQPATVRSQLKSVFRKTYVGRQQDLVRLLSSLSTI